MKATRKTRRSPSPSARQERRDLVGKVVRVEWEDIWADLDEHERKDWEQECVWSTFGVVVEDTPDLLRVAHEVLHHPTQRRYRVVTHILWKVVREVKIYGTADGPSG